jgi:hypothetical protein
MLKGSKQSMKKTFLFVLILSLILSFTFIGVHDTYAADNSDYSNEYLQTYQAGIKARIINPKHVSYEAFADECKTEIAPVYKTYLKQGGTGNFQQFAADNNYDQDPEGAENEQSTNANGIQILKANTTNARKGYHMKAGDILICHGTNSSGYFLGHAAIATSSKYIIEMQGSEFARDNNKHTPKKTFFKSHTKGKAYVLVYRMKKHPHYANDAGAYAFHRFYSKKGAHKKTVHLWYFVPSHLYSINPNYCSKLVYQAYWWGATKKALNRFDNGHVVTPYGLVGDFLGSYKPAKIHKITSY